MASLPSNFLDELRARTPIAALISRSVRLTRSGREQKGCCPFHGEKTPSFYVYDDHFHCFGCGEHGDAITFVMKSTGAAFMEAVETLAAEAGLEVPKASPQAAEAEQKRAGISEVLEAAAQTYQKWLFAPEGAAALGYLRGRGLTDATIQKFGLGWSGEGRGQLAAALRGQGITAEQLIEAGLMKTGDRGPVDMFFSRVMFPITDRRGIKISFSGRILGDGQPKYVNGPETPVFSKRRSLYGLNFAREAVRKGATLIVVEGQMDVIALSQTGFTGAVAPLGTAVTEEQLAEIWRLSPEPVICFDADAAGRRAALRTLDLALAALAPDRGLKFLRLPEKEDPDSIIRREGAAAFNARLEAAKPISAELYNMLGDGAMNTTPELRTKFRRRLIETANRIQDKFLASEYREMLLDRFFSERRTARENRTLKSHLSRPFDKAQRVFTTPEQADYLRGVIMTGILLERPETFSHIEDAFAGLDLSLSCDRIRVAMLRFAEGSLHFETDTISIYLKGLGLTEEASVIVAVSASQYRRNPLLSAGEVVSAWFHFYAFRSETLQALDLHKEELRLMCASTNDPELWEKYRKICQLVWRTRHGHEVEDV